MYYGEDNKYVPMPIIVGGILVVMLIAFIIGNMTGGDSMSVDKAVDYLTEEGYIARAADENLDMTNFKIVNVADGSADADAVNKGQLDTVDNKVDSVEDDIGFLVNDVEGLQAVWTTVSATLDGLGEDVEELQVAWASLGEDIDDMKTGIDSIGMNITALSGRVGLLEDNAEEVDVLLAELGESLTGIDERLVELEESVVVDPELYTEDFYNNVLAGFLTLTGAIDDIEDALVEIVARLEALETPAP